MCARRSTCMHSRRAPNKNSVAETVTLCIAPDSSAEDSSALSSQQIVVAAADAQSAKVIERALASQRWPHVRVEFPVAHAVNEALASGAHALLMAAGTNFTPNALESAWWALETRPEIGFIGFGDDRGSKTPMLETVAGCVVVRASLLSERAALCDTRWPGLAAVFALLERGARGHLLREPLITPDAACRMSNQTFAGAIAELRAKGLVDAVLGDPGHDPAPHTEPLQVLDEESLPNFGKESADDTIESGVSAKKLSANGKHNVLVLLQGFPMGGYTAFNADFLPRLVGRGHAVTVCTTEVWRTDWRLDNVRAATSDVMHAGGIVPLASMPRYVSHLISSREIDVVLVSHSLAAYRMLPWLRRQHPDTAFLDYVHTDWFEAQMYGSYAALGAAHADWLDAQVASSRTLANDLVRRGARPETTIAQPINLDVTDWDSNRFRAQEVRKSLGCAPNQPLILFAGRLSQEKRPLLAVECWKALVESGVDARFAVAGNGHLLAAMVDAVEKAGLKSRVEFLGELDGDMLRYVYSAADVYHAPSEIEGIARSLFEAMAMQCIPVVADVGGQHELVSAECGKLVAHGPEEVARYVRAIAAVLEPSVRTKLQKAARQRIVQHFTSAQCVAGFEAAFEVAVEQRRNANRAGVPAESRAAARELALSGLETMRRHFWRAHGR